MLLPIESPQLSRTRAGTETVRTVKMKSTVIRCWCCCPGLSVRGNVFAPLYLLENPHGMCLGVFSAGGIYSTLGLWCGVNLCL